MPTRVPEPHFPLTIQIDPNGIEWTHLIGMQRHVRTPDELPSALEAHVLPIIERLRSGTMQEFIVGEGALQKATEETLDILHLTGWWLEWDRRRVIAHGEFNCTHCASTIKIEKHPALRLDKHIYRCPNRKCLTHALVSQATGDPILTVVEEEKSA